MRAWFVPDFMYEAVFWGIKYIDLALIIVISLTIRKIARFVRWLIQANDNRELE